MLKKIPIQNIIFKNTDEVGLDELASERINCDVDDLGNIISTPGLLPFVTLNKSGGDIQGFYYWKANDIVIAVSGGRIYKINRSGDVVDITGATLLPHNRVSFTSDNDYLFMANGGRIVFYSLIFGQIANDVDSEASKKLDVDGVLGGIYIDELLGDHTLYYLDESAPTQVSHVAYMNKQLFCNSIGTSNIHYSEVNIPTQLRGYFSAESNTDNIVALFEMRNELVLVGTESIEFWESAGTNPDFIRVGGQDIARGTYSPDTCQIIDNTLYMLDNERRLSKVVRNIQDRSMELQALSINKEIDSFTDISKVQGDHVLAGGRNYYVLTSPVDEKTYVFDYVKNAWTGQWAYWDEGVGQWKRWRGNCSLFVSQWNAHLVGDCANGKIYKMSNTVNTEDGKLVRRIPVRTGHISRGTLNWKQADTLLIKLKMDADRITARNSKLSLRWRDDNGEWENERIIDLGNIGQHQFIHQEDALGMYHTRQYELEYYGDGKLMICGMEEDFNILGN